MAYQFVIFNMHTSTTFNFTNYLTRSRAKFKSKNDSYNNYCYNK